ncbi:hypothetical protein FB451DRAFT_536159 [Mycena latifolia]|nr:hypothetical protein FB451DRAFT_536159 [Mycena latifolia]
MGRGRTVSLQQLDVDLRALLQAHHPSSKAVLASIGHLLLPSPLSVMDWIGKRSEPTVFNPTLPTALLDAHPVQHRVLHRLVYHAIRAGDDVAPHKIIKMELDLPRSMKEPAISNEDFVEPKFHPSCWLGQKSDVNVMMLDRPADIQFSIFDSDILAAHQWPSELEQYISNLRAFLSYQDRDASQPETPLTVVHENVTYLLHSSLIVQQNVEHTEIDGSSTVKVITESAVDLEGDQKSASCQVICDDITPDLNWHSFLRQCDAMSTISPTSKRAPLL